MRRKILNPKIWVIFAGVVLASSVLMWWMSRPHKAERAVREVAKIAETVHRMYADKASYWHLDTSSFIAAQKSAYRTKDGHLLNALGKDVLIGSGENGETVMPGEKSFDVVFDNLNTGECVNAAAYQFGRQEMLNLLQIEIIGKERQIFAWGNAEYELPIARFAAKRFCSDGSKIVWTFE